MSDALTEPVLLFFALRRSRPSFTFAFAEYLEMKTHISAIASLAVLLGTAEATTHANSPKYDFVIVGGGTSGLVVANRLSENKDITVAVIEAGDSVYNNPNVTNVSGYGRAFGTHIDWAYPTVPQEYAGGGKQIMRAGKAIGGTSTINGEQTLTKQGRHRRKLSIL